MSYVTDGTIGIDVTRVTATQEFSLGQVHKGTNDTEWVYCQDSGSGLTQYDYACIDEAFSATTGTTTLLDAGYQVGFPQVAFTASYYGWIPITGKGIYVNALTSCAADTTIYTSGTAGKLDDSVSAGSQISGIVLTSAAGGTATATACPIIATHPFATSP